MDSYFDIEFLHNSQYFTYRIPFFSETNLIMVFDLVNNQDRFFEYIFNSIINNYIKSKEDIEEITIY